MKPTIGMVREVLEHEAFNAAENGYEDVANGLRALAASLDGMVIVPREPTKKMLEAAAVQNGATRGIVDRRCWNAMLAAAQEETP